MIMSSSQSDLRKWISTVSKAKNQDQTPNASPLSSDSKLVSSVQSPQTSVAHLSDPKPFIKSASSLTTKKDDHQVIAHLIRPIDPKLKAASASLVRGHTHEQKPSASNHQPGPHRPLIPIRSHEDHARVAPASVGVANAMNSSRYTTPLDIRPPMVHIPQVLYGDPSAQVYRPPPNNHSSTSNHSPAVYYLPEGQGLPAHYQYVYEQPRLESDQIPPYALHPYYPTYMYAGAPYYAGQEGPTYQSGPHAYNYPSLLTHSYLNQSHAQEAMHPVEFDSQGKALSVKRSASSDTIDSNPQPAKMLKKGKSSTSIPSGTEASSSSSSQSVQHQPSIHAVSSIASWAFPVDDLELLEREPHSLKPLPVFKSLHRGRALGPSKTSWTIEPSMIIDVFQIQQFLQTFGTDVFELDRVELSQLTLPNLILSIFNSIVHIAPLALAYTKLGEACGMILPEGWILDPDTLIDEAEAIEIELSLFKRFSGKQFTDMTAETHIKVLQYLVHEVMEMEEFQKAQQNMAEDALTIKQRLKEAEDRKKEAQSRLEKLSQSLQIPNDSTGSSVESNDDVRIVEKENLTTSITQEQEAKIKEMMTYPSADFSDASTVNDGTEDLTPIHIHADIDLATPTRRNLGLDKNSTKEVIVIDESSSKHGTRSESERPEFKSAKSELTSATTKYDSVLDRYYTLKRAVRRSPSDQLVGMDRFGRGYWWCVLNGPPSALERLNSADLTQILQSTDSAFGILVEHGYSGLCSSRTLKDAISVTGWSFIPDMKTLLELYSSLCGSGIREKRLRSNLSQLFSNFNVVLNPDEETKSSANDFVDACFSRFGALIHNITSGDTPLDVSFLQQYSSSASSTKSSTVTTTPLQSFSQYANDAIRSRLKRIFSLPSYLDPRCRGALDRVQDATSDVWITLLKDWNDQGWLKLLPANAVQIFLEESDVEMTYSSLYERLNDLEEAVEKQLEKEKAKKKKSDKLDSETSSSRSVSPLTMTSKNERGIQIRSVYKSYPAKNGKDKMLTRAKTTRTRDTSNSISADNSSLNQESNQGVKKTRHRGSKDSSPVRSDRKRSLRSRAS